MSDEEPPLLRAKAYDQPSVFEPANLLPEGRRQRARPDVPVPAVCLLGSTAWGQARRAGSASRRSHPPMPGMA